ncbi:hypothetical protein GWK47_036125 [Chionoecetes opilio]|uniref:Uncharacterized protein n=1 Tax=Chionoecetes opilio TaxID=41210 RepID=A0A8J4YMP6_CHIOP|nr:hypothetical protein GWK47_036125 [Chionoecetes opilio]
MLKPQQDAGGTPSRNPGVETCIGLMQKLWATESMVRPPAKSLKSNQTKELLGKRDLQDQQFMHLFADEDLTDGHLEPTPNHGGPFMLKHVRP